MFVFGWEGMHLSLPEVRSATHCLMKCFYVCLLIHMVFMEYPENQLAHVKFDYIDIILGRGKACFAHTTLSILIDVSTFVAMFFGFVNVPVLSLL